MTTHYLIVVDGKPGAYGMWVPDLPGCTSMADISPRVDDSLSGNQ